MLCDDLGNKTMYNEGATRWRATEAGAAERRGTAGPSAWGTGAVLPQGLGILAHRESDPTAQLMAGGASR